MKNFIQLMVIVLFTPSLLLSKIYEETTTLIIDGFNPSIDFFDMDSDGDMNYIVSMDNNY